MRVLTKPLVGALACCVAVALIVQSGAMGQQPAQPQADRPQVEKDRAPDRAEADRDDYRKTKTFRTGQITGLNVRNKEGERLGRVNDIVIDIKTGKVEYVAVAVGTILGVGGRLHAVPFEELEFTVGPEGVLEDDMYFVLDMTRDQIDAAPGFDRGDWPAKADPHWAQRHREPAEVLTGEEENRTEPRQPRQR